MSLFRSSAHVGGVKYRPLKEGLTEVVSTITLPADHVLATTNTLRFFQFGANTRIHEIGIATDDLDTGGVPALTLNVGFLSHNPAVTASNPTAYAAASTIGQTGGFVRLEPTVATPAANYTLQIVPAAAASANVGVKRVTVTAVIGPERGREGLLANGYRFGRATPAV